MTAVFRRELRSLLCTMTAYVFIAAFLLSAGLFFTVNNIFMASDRFSAVLLSTSYIMILTMPALTMRAFAEERKSGIDKMIFCAPIKLSDIVLGKFLAILCVFLAALLLSLIFPAIIAVLGKPYWGEILLGYAGCFLVGTCLASVGIFVSAMSENQISSALVSAVALMALFLAGAVGPSIPYPAAADFVSGSSPFYYLNMFRIGIIMPFPVVFLIGFTVLFIYLTIVAIDRRLWRSHSRLANKNADKRRHNTYVLCLSALLAACLSACGLLALKLQDDYNVVGDFSRGATFSLSNRTKEMLDGISENVEIYAVYERDARDATITNLLAAYDRASDKVSFKIVDPVRSPAELLKLNIDGGVSLGNVVVFSESTGRTKVLDYYSLYLLGDSGIIGVNAEQSVSSAIHYVLGGKQATLLLTTGHGEAEPQSYAQFITDSASRNFSIAMPDTQFPDYSYLQPNVIPVFVSPQTDISPEERDSLIKHLDNGGSAAFFMDNSRSSNGGAGIMLGKTEFVNFNAVFQRFGVSLNRDLLVAPPEKAAFGIVTAFQPIVIGNAFSAAIQEGGIVTSESSSLLVSEGASAVMVSPAECYSKNIEGLTDLERNADDPSGPFVTAALGSGKGQMFISGTSSFIIGEGFSHDGNRTFALAAMSYLAGDEGNPVAPPKFISDGKLNVVSLSQQLILAVIAVPTLPVLVSIAGVIVLQKRRRAS